MPNVLLVDDLKQNLYALERILSVLEIDIDTASSGQEALSLMLDKSYAVVILDVQMPEMDGFEIAKIMHENDTTKHTPIIFVTAINKEEKHVNFGYEIGAVDYLFKPVDPQILRSKVKVFVDLFKIEQKLKKAKEDIENTLCSVTDSVITVDRNCHIQYFNPAAKNIINSESSLVKGSYIFNWLYFSNENYESYEEKIKQAINKKQKVKFNEKIKITNLSTQSHIVELTIVPLININNRYIGVVFTIHDVTESEKLADKLYYQATHDPLPISLIGINWLRY